MQPQIGIWPLSVLRPCCGVKLDMLGVSVCGAHLTNNNGEWPIIWPVNDAFNKDGARLDKAPSFMSVMDIHEMLAIFADTVKRSMRPEYELLEHAQRKRLLSVKLFHPLGDNTDRRIWRLILSTAHSFARNCCRSTYCFA